MSPTLQIHLIPLGQPQSSRILKDTTSPATVAWLRFLVHLRAARGAEVVYWAKQLDNPDIVGVFTLWTSFQPQREWEKHVTLEKMTEDLAEVMDRDVWKFFTNKRFTVRLGDAEGVRTKFKGIFKAPLTKVWTWYFPISSSLPAPTRSSDGDEDFSEKLAVFVAANATASTLLLHTGGWRVEEDIIRDTPAYSYTGFVGQRNADDFKQMPPFENNLVGRIGLNMRTFAMTEVVIDAGGAARRLS